MLLRKQRLRFGLVSLLCLVCGTVLHSPFICVAAMLPPPPTAVYIKEKDQQNVSVNQSSVPFVKAQKVDSLYKSINHRQSKEKQCCKCLKKLLRN